MLNHMYDIIVKLKLFSLENELLNNYLSKFTQNTYIKYFVKLLNKYHSMCNWLFKLISVLDVALVEIYLQNRVKQEKIIFFFDGGVFLTNP